MHRENKLVAILLGCVGVGILVVILHTAFLREKTSDAFSKLRELTQDEVPEMSDSYDPAYLPSTLFPREFITADVMEPSADPKSLEVLSKFQAAIRSDNEWFLDYIAEKSIPGEPLPYHPKFGVTEEEYASLNEGQFSFSKNGELKLRFVPYDNGVYEIETQPVSSFSGVLIDSQRGLMDDADFGNLPTLSLVDNTDPKSPTGPWKGASWKYSENSDSVIGYVQFGVGVRGEAGDQGIMYRRVEMLVREGKESSTETLFYPLAK